MKYAGPLKISIVYLLTGFIWIYGSDSFARAFFPAASQQYLFQTIKGIFYVVSTALLLYYMLRRFYKAQQQKVDELRESEQRYQFLFLSSPLAKIIYDADTGKIQEVNERACVFLGLSEEELLRRQITEVIPEKKMTELSELEGVIRYVKPDGIHLTLEAAASAFNYKGTHMVLLSLDDVSVREEAQQLLEEHRRKLMAAQKIANIGYWQSFNGLYWSDEVYKIWGLDKDTFELNYESFLQTVYPEDRYLFFSEYEDVDKDELEYDIEHRFVRPDGSIRWARQWGMLIRKDKNSPFRERGDCAGYHRCKEHFLVSGQGIQDGNDRSLGVEYI
ncbi:MAG: PAS domain-containing protein [Chitinophagaceae bacterium]